jgi:hypothetical protein
MYGDIGLVVHCVVHDGGWMSAGFSCMHAIMLLAYWKH